jgi:tRNA (guanine37-N1)-methyltransferase
MDCSRSNSSAAGAAPSSPSLHVAVATIFPDLVVHYCAASVLGRAQAAGLLQVDAIDLRRFATDRHRTVDDTPFGGGPGMVMKPEPIVELARSGVPRPLIELMELGSFTLLCGRYEGFDDRALKLAVDDQLSIGDFVLAGGELAALVVLEAVARLVPGVLGNSESAGDESFAEAAPYRVEYPHFTRPAVFEGHAVPEVLLSGDHARVARWRRAQAVLRTIQRRPDLIERDPITAAEHALLREFGLEPDGD